MGARTREAERHHRQLRILKRPEILRLADPLSGERFERAPGLVGSRAREQGIGTTIET